MELSLQSKYKRREILAKRREIIEKEKLHIKDLIDAEEFSRLYSIYGSEFEQKEFAYAFLDIDNARYDTLIRGKKVSILSREYVPKEEFKSIREKLIDIYDLKAVSYNSSIELYENFGQRLSFKLFSEEVLGIDEKTLKSRNLKRSPNREIPVNFDIEPGEYATSHSEAEEMLMYVLNPEYILNLRKRVIYEEGLHIGESIDYEKFSELYAKYGKDMSEDVFSQEVLDINIRSLSRMKGPKKFSTAILQNVEIPERYITTLRDKIAMLNKLEGGQLLEYTKLQEFHRKYARELLERDFAINVLEVESESYRFLPAGINSSVTILKSRETNFEALRNKLIKEMNLHYDDMIDYETFVKWHQSYAPNMREVVFAERVLNIGPENFKEVKHRKGKARILLDIKLPSKEEIIELRKKVIKENRFHINDEIDYIKLQELHLKYGGIMSIEMFAVDVLLMSQPKIRVLKRDYEKNKDSKDAKLKKACVLLNYEIPLEEIEELKNTIKRTENLEEPQMMTKEEIEGLYEKYGGIMSFNMFLQGILCVSIKNFENLKYQHHKTTLVCVREGLKDDEIKQLVRLLANDLSEDEIAMEMELPRTLLRSSIKELSKSQEFADDILYEKVKLLSEENVSVSNISTKLGISQEEVREFLKRYKRERIEEYENLRQEKKEQKAKEKKESKRELVKARAIRALDKYIFNDKNIKNVRAYIADCKESFEEGNFQRSDIDFLMECMIFIQCNCKEIELVSKMCIHFNEYRRGMNFIAENIDNEGISRDEREKLMSLRNSMEYAIRQEQALQRIKAGDTDVQQIARATGIREVDVLKLRKKIEEESINMFDGSSRKKDDDQFVV